MKKIIITSIVALVILISGGFYWFAVRPGEIRKECWENAKKLAGDISSMELVLEDSGMTITKKVDYEKVRDDRLRACLLEYGLVK